MRGLIIKIFEIAIIASLICCACFCIATPVATYIEILFTNFLLFAVKLYFIALL